MVMSIEELKNVIQDQMVLKNGSENITITRSANNILRIHGRLVTWTNLQDILGNGEYDLTKDGKKIVTPETRDKLDEICSRTGQKRSDLIEEWIKEKF
jgi:hypothetical protein